MGKEMAAVNGEADKEKWIEQARHLARGLERISADSRWAHRASGYRGALLKQLDRLENTPEVVGNDLDSLKLIMDAGYTLLVKAAREIRVEPAFLTR